MEGLGNSPAYWGDRAKKARSTARCLSNPLARQHMLNCAMSYDRLARMAERPALGQGPPNAANDNPALSQT